MQPFPTAFSDKRGQTLYSCLYFFLRIFAIYLTKIFNKVVKTYYDCSLFSGFSKCIQHVI